GERPQVSSALLARPSLESSFFSVWEGFLDGL
ncbi:MAG: hypothetical protein K0S45_4410, partial [Nitrospira sp.]|nr:hypothetical protein [Nitrospira sp.]